MEAKHLQNFLNNPRILNALEQEIREIRKAVT